jgi:hypothetical protein
LNRIRVSGGASAKNKALKNRGQRNEKCIETGNMMKIKLKEEELPL